MSWFSKTVKKISRSVKKHLGKHWWVPGYNLVKGHAEIFGGAIDEYNRNKDLYNRMALMVGGSILTGGALGAAAGAMGVGTAAGGAAAGATTGAISGSIAAGGAAYQDRQMDKALEEQERIQKEAEAEQQRLARYQALTNAAVSPTEQTALSFMGYSNRGSQIRRTQVSRNKKVGGSASTLG